MKNEIYAGLSDVMFSYLDENINQRDNNGTFADFKRDVVSIAETIATELREKIEGKYYVTEEYHNPFSRVENCFRTLEEATVFYNGTATEAIEACLDCEIEIVLYDFVNDEILASVVINPSGTNARPNYNKYYLHNEGLVNLMKKKIGTIESFYTGGNIWLSCMHEDVNGHYYCIDNYYDCLSYFDDGYEDGEEFPFYSMVWSKSVEELDEKEKDIFNKLKADLEKTEF